jgi:histidinol-phosphate/aromatic aminotransferase/cobyric acid decarboxylase-like protein
VLTTNGAAEAFWLIAAGLRPRNAAIVHPSFTESEVALRNLGMPVTHVFRCEDDFDLDPARVPNDCDVVFLCNPNNPTGTLDPVASVRRLAAPDRVVVVDEAFMDFCQTDRESLASGPAADMTLVVRSVTKLLSVPGIRAGYVLGPRELIDRMRAVRQPWSVNTLALTVLGAYASRPEAGKAIAAEVAHAREGLIASLRGIQSIRVWPSAANFVLIEVPDGPTTRAMLHARGFALRPCETFPGLSSNHLRIAVRSEDDNRALIEALQVAMRSA